MMMNAMIQIHLLEITFTAHSLPQPVVVVLVYIFTGPKDSAVPSATKKAILLLLACSISAEKAVGTGAKIAEVSRKVDRTSRLNL
ncbi:hypothetical protein [Xylanibacillus composti]|uniref:hypothetical protein n=1 Tax=Xylanibacillus composti TaxID=1572762 RepID=UPI001BCE392E|nr:hypothetical protein [Xylanibacillus composti]